MLLAERHCLSSAADERLAEGKHFFPSGLVQISMQEASRYNKIVAVDSQLVLVV